MSRIILIISILIICAASLFLKTERGVYSIISNFSLLPLGILAYMGGWIYVAAGALICIAFLLYSTISRGIGFLSISPVLCAYCVTPFAFAVFKNISEDGRHSLLADLNAAEDKKTALQEKNARLDRELKELDRRVSEIVGLYEITKEMSASLLFSEIFQILSEFLKRNFKFTACRLILTRESRRQEAGETSVEMVYKIENTLGGAPLVAGGLKAQGDKPELIDSAILAEIYAKKDIIYCEGFIAIPLLIRGRVIGIINVEGLETAALEKFLIVARQFSVEMEKVRLYETVQELAITDGLTGIFVRRYFLERLKEELERSRRLGLKLSFLMIDLDHFKKCNDTFGHLIGDIVLRGVAQVLKQGVREIDLLVRYGGEEFSILLPETDKVGAEFVGERLREAVAKQDFNAYDELVKMTISVGVATFPDDIKTTFNNGAAGEIANCEAELIEAADHALYAAKAQGRNRVTAFIRR